MAKTLTVGTLDKIKPGAARQEHPDAAQPGLYFVVQPSGARSWAVRYRHEGRPRKATLGSYPKIRLPAARELAQATLRKASEGHDPAAEKIEARRIAAAGLDKAGLLETVWTEYQDRHLSTVRERTATAAKQMFKVRILPKLGKRRLAEVTKRDVLGVLDDLIKAGYPSAANRARAVMTAFFNWALARDIIAVSPCAGVQPPSAVRFRNRVLTDDEVRWLWKACDKDPHPFGRMIQLLILTGGRRDEVKGITDKELKLSEKLWKLPAARAKNDREHDVHLSDTAISIIEAVPRIKNKPGFIFCTTGETPPSGFSRAKHRIDKQMLEYAREDAKHRGNNPDDVEIPNWVLHDLRRTMASGMARLGIQLPVIERCLNHVSGSFGGIVSVYQRHSFADEKKAALETWSAHIEGLVSLVPIASNVTQLRSARRSR